MEFTVPPVPAGHHPGDCWRHTVTALDLAQKGGRVLTGDWLAAGDLVDLPAGRLVVVVDKVTTGWADDYRTGGPLAVKAATVTVHRIGEPEPVWTRHFKRSTSAFGATTRKKLAALLAAAPVPDGAPKVVNEARRYNDRPGTCRWCDSTLVKGAGHLTGHGENILMEHYQQCPSRPLDFRDPGVCELCGVEVVAGQAQRVLLREGEGRWVVLHLVERFGGGRRMCEVAPVPTPAEQRAAAQARRDAEQAEREKKAAAAERNRLGREKRAAAKRAAEQAEQDRVAGLATVSRTTENLFAKKLGAGGRARLDEHTDLLEDGTTTLRWTVTVNGGDPGFNGEDYDPDPDTAEEYTTKNAARAHYQSLKWEPAPYTPAHSGPPCDNCGRRGARHERHDSSGIPGLVCTPCSSAPSVELSFA